MVKKNKPKLAKAIYEAMINACNCRRGRGRVMCSGSKICKLCEFFQTVYCKLEFVTCLLKYVWFMESHEPNVAISPSDSFRSLSTRSRFAISNYSFLFLSISHNCIIINKHFKDSTNPIPSFLFLLRLSSAQTQPAPERNHHRHHRNGSQNRVLHLPITPSNIHSTQNELARRR